MRYFEVTVTNNLGGSTTSGTVPASSVAVAVTRVLKANRFDRRLNGGITIAVRELGCRPAGFCKCGHSIDAHVGGSGRCAAARCKCGGALDPQNPARERRLGKHAADYVPNPAAEAAAERALVEKWRREDAADLAAGITCPDRSCRIVGDHDHNLLADVFSVPAVRR